MKKTLILLSAIALLFTSCSKELDLQPDAKKASVNKLQNAIITNGITKFVFTKADNPSLNEDEEGIITEDNQINVTIYADGVSLTNLKPTITYNGEALLSPLSGVVKDFTRQVMYSYYNTEFGTSTTYKVKVTLKPASERPNVYISGIDFKDYRARAVYWRNGKMTVLSDENPNTAVALDIKVDASNNVYVCGIETYPGYIEYQPVYWKNGVKTNLYLNEGETGRALSIAVSGNDTYIAGSVTKNYVEKAVLWKNGNRIELTDGASTTRAESIFISDNNVYIGGYITGEHGYIPVYWKNGVLVKLPYAYSSALVSSIFVVGDDVYAAGQDDFKAVYWKKGMRYELEDGIARSITVHNNDVYVTGNFGNDNDRMAGYWKNGTFIRLNIVGIGNWFRSTAMTFDHNSDIYVVGENNIDAFYWKNGIGTRLSQTSTSAWPTSIFVKKN